VFNLLTEPLMRAVEIDGTAQDLTLPEVFAALAADRILRFPALRPHQAPAWHAFLVQVGAMGAEALEIDRPPGDDPAAWAELLRALTPDHAGDEPWHLVGPPQQPAFLQPPVPDGDLSGFATVTAPDALDLLVTSKNHDLKASRMTAAAADDWLFALLSLQTQEGFLGAGNYGIARMNGGFGNRPYMRLGPKGGGFGVQVLRDQKALIEDRDKIRQKADEFDIGRNGSVGLIWLEAWDGVASLDLQDLHPLFVEICRRVRLVAEGGRLLARTASSKAARIDSKSRNGVLDDPWAPVEQSEQPKVLTISAEGFSYRKVTELLFGSDKRTYHLPRLATLRRTERNGPVLLQLQALARGQGKTEGFHCREIEISPSAAARLADDALADRARKRVQQAGTAEGKVLRQALITLMQKGPSQPSWSKPSNESLVRPALGRFDQAVDAAFFQDLWASLDQDEDAATLLWLRFLADLARTALTEAAKAAPQSGQRRIIALARARNMLEAALVKQFPQLAHKREDVDAA